MRKKAETTTDTPVKKTTAKKKPAKKEEPAQAEAKPKRKYKPRVKKAVEEPKPEVVEDAPDISMLANNRLTDGNHEPIVNEESLENTRLSGKKRTNDINPFKLSVKL